MPRILPIPEKQQQPNKEQEIELVLALLLPRFRLALQPGARIDRYHILTQTPAHGLPMHINAQDRRFQRSPMRGNIREIVELDG